MQLFSLLHLLLLLAVARSNPTRHGRNTKSSEKGGRANIPNQKAVFAHFMVGNVYSWTDSDWASDIKLAQDAHIDAFALNIAYGDDTVSKSLGYAFTAANNLGFKLFISFDYAGGGAWPKNAVLSLLQAYTSDPAYYQYNGQPLVSTFEGPNNGLDWIDIKATTGCFFIPDWSSLGAKFALEIGNGTADGLLSWAAWPYGDIEMNTYTDASYIQYLNATGTPKPYMMPVSPWFYTNLPGYNKNWLWRGDDLWYTRWQEVIYLQPDFVEILSWNDYGESHYIGPLHDEQYDLFEMGPYNYAMNMTHDGWRLFLPYLIDTYKTGIGSITEEGLVSWYRLNPSNSTGCSSNGTTGNTATQLQIEMDPGQVVEDKIFYSALLTAPADVTVSIGGISQPAKWTNGPTGNIGIYYGSVPFNGATGPVVVKISRSNQVIAVMNGAPITTHCIDGITNYNAWVGTAVGGTIASVSPTQFFNASLEGCIAGKGIGNFDGLCKFACGLGYCPIGACYCIAMGPQSVLPEAQNVTGYPIASGSDDYNGLCAFSCNYDYCPPTACTTVKVPVSTPSVSPFTPNACISGTGDGALLGLCEYSCNYGFCPKEACSCTATGPLIPAPVANHSVSGYATRGEYEPDSYNGLCNFACSRGYCPDPCNNTLPANSTSFNNGPILVSPEIWTESDPVLGCIPLSPCTFVFPPLLLSTTTTISIPPWTTSFVQSYETTQMTTFYGESTATSIEGYVFVTQTTVLTMAPITTAQIPVWGQIVPAGLATSSGTPYIFNMTSSIDLPTQVVTFIPNGTSGSTGSPITATITPPPFPWSQTTRDTILNTKSTSWTHGSQTSTCTSGCGIPCGIWCDGPCLTCSPGSSGSKPHKGGPPGSNNNNGGDDGDDGDNNDGDDNDGDDNGDDNDGDDNDGDDSNGDDSNDDDEKSSTKECSTSTTATACTTACISNSCSTICQTATGCSPTGIDVLTVVTPAPGYLDDKEIWPTTTSEDDSVSIPDSMEIQLTSDSSGYATRLVSISFSTTTLPISPTSTVFLTTVVPASTTAPAPTPKPTAKRTGIVVAGYTVCQQVVCEYQWEIFGVDSATPTFPGCSTDGALYSSVVTTPPHQTGPIPKLGPFSVGDFSDCYYDGGIECADGLPAGYSCSGCNMIGMGVNVCALQDPVSCEAGLGKSYQADVYCFFGDR